MRQQWEIVSEWLLRPGVMTGLLLIYVLFHLSTITVSPLPWFDEVFFASVARSWAEDRSFELLAAPFFTGGKELLTHGPVYFILTGTMFEWFGFGIIQFRMVNLISGFIILYLFYRLMSRHLQLSPGWAAAGVALLALDTVFNMSMHNGRMDIFALILMLAGTIAMLEAGSRSELKAVMLYSILGGVAGTVAILTSPRTGFFFLPLAIVVILRAFRHRETIHWYAIAGWGSPVAVLIAAWFFYAFEGWSDMIAHYEVYSVMVSGGMQIPEYQYPLIALTAAAIGYMGWQDYRLLYSDLNLLILGAALIFNTLVFDTGAYSVMMVPFYYLLILQAARLPIRIPALPKWAVALLLLMNLGIFSFKAFAVLGTWQERNPEPVNTFISKHIPENARVAAEEQFYYGVIRAGADFHFSNRLVNLAEREQYLRREFDYNYLIISEAVASHNPSFFEHFDQHAELEHVASYQYEGKPPQLISSMLDATGFSILTSFDCHIYERVD